MKTNIDAFNHYKGEWPEGVCEIWANYDDHLFLPVLDGHEIIDEDAFYFVCDQFEFNEART